MKHLLHTELKLVLSPEGALLLGAPEGSRVVHAIILRVAGFGLAKDERARLVKEDVALCPLWRVIYSPLWIIAHRTEPASGPSWIASSCFDRLRPAKP